MRQADSTIKGYSYQFIKSVLEILEAEEDAAIVLEGVIEDIDIRSPSITTTIQCKYHEDKKYLISSVSVPILEMLCHYCECSYLGKPIKYILYAYFSENVDEIDIATFIDFLNSTKNKEILCKYFHQIYSVPDSNMLNIANKPKKTEGEKTQLVNYYKKNRSALTLRVNISAFWSVFKYVKADQFDQLKSSVIQKLESISEHDTAESLYFPNAFSLVASLSAKGSEIERTITKNEFISFLEQQKSVLVNRWTLEALGHEQLLKAKKAYLASCFSSNPDARVFVFSDLFLKNSNGDIIAFVHEYLSKYYRKPKLQKPPIFIFGNNHSMLMQTALLELYKYQRQVNTGLLGTEFVADNFINNKNCASDFSCKMAVLQNISAGILEQCNANQVYLIGDIDMDLSSPNYSIEELDVPDINTVRYLVGLSKVLEV